MASDEHALLLQISYDLSRLQKQSDQAQGIVDKGLTTMERRAKTAATNLESALSLKGANLEGALGEIFSSTRLKVLDSATARVGLFGNALEALGPIGLAAGAAIGAAGFAIENSFKTGAWAEDLKRASDTLGLTTTQLQEFDFVFQSMGIDVARGRETLSGLEKTIGLVESGLARSQQVRVFTDALKITPDQLRGWGTLEQQLPHILDALAKLDPEERAAAAERLRVDPEVLNSLVEARQRISDLIDEAHKYGIVLGEDVINKSAEAEGKMRALSTVAQDELRVAFVDLAPALLGVVKGFADSANALADFIRGVKDALGPVADLISLLRRIPGASQSGGGFSFASVLGPFGVPFDALIAQGARERKFDALQPRVTSADMQALLHPVTPGAFSTDAHRGGRGRSGAAAPDHTAAETAKVNEALDSANKGLVDALKGLTTDLDERARFERQAIDDEAAKEREKLEAERAKILADQTIAGPQATILDAKLQQAEAEVEQTRLAKQALLARQTELQKQQQAETLSNLRADGQLDLLKAEQGVFQTTENRRKLALEIFQTEEQIAEDKLKQQIADAELAKDAQKEADARQQLANLQATAPLRQQAVSEANPANAWDAWVQSAQQATKDVGASFAQMKVDTIDTFNQSLFDSEGRLRSFGDIVRSVSSKILVDSEQFFLKSIEAGLFGGAEGQGGNPLTNFFGGLGGAAKGGGNNANPLTRLLGLGANKPDGSAGNPFFVKGLDGGAGGGGPGGLLGNLFGGLFGGGGASAGGNTANELLSGLEMGSVPFAGGGSFVVGGRGGIDKNLAMLRLSSGERVTIETPEQQRTGALRGGDRYAQITVVTPDADSFRRSSRQVARETKRSLGMA